MNCPGWFLSLGKHLQAHSRERGIWLDLHVLAGVDPHYTKWILGGENPYGLAAQMLCGIPLF